VYEFLIKIVNIKI